ncbi:MAG: hypothetical protein KGL11_11730 [Alphaproteobacteria bacterium]|nr:hypothetical protein [Alphaproteobacteria bacterium]
MANLWRVLAIAWLGGVASPALMDEPATVGDALTAPVVAESAVEASPTSTEAVQLDADTAEDAPASHHDDAG